MSKQEDKIHKEIADVFKKLIELKPNASFVCSYAFATSKDIKKADVDGRMNICGSKEEIELHLQNLQEGLVIQEKKYKKKKGRIYGKQEENTKN